MTKSQLQDLLGQETKYSKTYIYIILKAQKQNRKKLTINSKDYIYYEKHHILPSSIFPEYKDLKCNCWNSVLLTAREHILCHLLLWKHYKKLNTSKNNTIKMYFAISAMLNHKSDTMQRNFTFSKYAYTKKFLKDEDYVEKINEMKTASHLKGVKTRKSNGSYKSAQIKIKEKRLNDLDENGLNSYQRAALKSSQTTKELGLLAKDKHPLAMKIYILNDKNETVSIAHGNFGETIKKLGMPMDNATRSFKQKVRFQYDKPHSNTKLMAIKRGFYKFNNWLCIKVLNDINDIDTYLNKQIKIYDENSKIEMDEHIKKIEKMFSKQKGSSKYIYMYYNEKDELVYENNIPYKVFCKEKGIPSSIHNKKIAYNDKGNLTKAKAKGYDKYIGWHMEKKLKRTS